MSIRLYSPSPGAGAGFSSPISARGPSPARFSTSKLTSSVAQSVLVRAIDSQPSSKRKISPIELRKRRIQMVNKIRRQELSALKKAGLVLGVFSYEYGESSVFLPDTASGETKAIKAEMEITRVAPLSKIYKVTFKDDGVKKSGAVVGQRRGNASGRALAPITPNRMSGRTAIAIPKPEFSDLYYEFVHGQSDKKFVQGQSAKDYYSKKLKRAARDTRNPFVKLLSGVRRFARTKMNELRQNPGKALGKVLNVGNALAVVAL